MIAAWRLLCTVGDQMTFDSTLFSYPFILFLSKSQVSVSQGSFSKSHFTDTSHQSQSVCVCVCVHARWRLGAGVVVSHTNKQLLDTSWVFYNSAQFSHYLLPRHSNRSYRLSAQSHKSAPNSSISYAIHKSRWSCLTINQRFPRPLPCV